MTATARDIQTALPQVGAIPFRRGDDGELEILLVTSRETRRWIVPKGWPMRGRKAHQAAAIEARQEAGVVGRIGKKPVGSYLYKKRRSGGPQLCRVELYLLEVERQLTKWDEQEERDLCWMRPADAARAVRDPDLAELMLNMAQP